MKRSAPMRRTAFVSKPAASGKPAPRAKRATLKTKQRAVTADEKELWDRLAALGCIACMRDGVFEPDVSIHHVDGRTKPGCHQLVLALCASHHQDGTGKNPHYLAVHPWKFRFEQRFGTQKELMVYSTQLLQAVNFEKFASRVGKPEEDNV